MDTQNFWAIIDATLSPDQDVQASALEAQLLPLDIEALNSFSHHYDAALQKAYHWDLWGAAYIINGGCSDDGFDYFRDWLISRGSETYHAALKDPETLIGKAVPYDTEFECFRYVMDNVFETQHNAERPDTVSPSSGAHDPQGDAWDEDDVETLFPNLAAWVEQSRAPVAVSLPSTVRPAGPTSPPSPPAAPQKRSWLDRLLGRK